MKVAKLCTGTKEAEQCEAYCCAIEKHGNLPAHCKLSPEPKVPQYRNRKPQKKYAYTNILRELASVLASSFFLNF